MSLAKKLNLKDGMKLRVLRRPEDVDLADVVTTTSAKADGVLVFVASLADLGTAGAPIVEAAKADRLAWVAYPKAGQLGTDLNRDVLYRELLAQGIKGVRQIALDPVWSAMRFRTGA